MIRRVEVAITAQRDADLIIEYFDSAHSIIIRWWDAFRECLGSLEYPRMTSIKAPESDLFEEPIYQKYFGPSKKNLYRVLYIERGERVIVLRIRSCRQQMIDVEDLILPD